MRLQNRALRWVAYFLKVLLALNLVILAGFIVGLAASWLSKPILAAHLMHKYGASLNLGSAITVLRLLILLGMASAVAVHSILTSLIRIVATVGRGDPFIDANATLLIRIGWALLALQLLDLCLGALGRWITMLKLHWMGWTPSIGGWLAVIMIFVLARVFRIGAEMRDDLAATV